MIAADLAQPAFAADVNAAVAHLAPAGLRVAGKTEQRQGGAHAIEFRRRRLGLDRGVGRVERREDGPPGRPCIREGCKGVAEFAGNGIDRHLTRHFARIGAADAIADEQQRGRSARTEENVQGRRPGLHEAMLSSQLADPPGVLIVKAAYADIGQSVEI